MLKKVLIFSVLLGFISCTNSLSEKEKEQYTKKGKEIAQASFKELSSNLMHQMKQGGPALAVPFCNSQAMPLTNQMEEKFDVTIKRASNKVRNPVNKATERELEIITAYENLKKDKKGLTPIVEIDSNGKKHFYAPIIIKAKCLVCHGVLNEQLSIKTDSLIKAQYPSDMAVAYKEGDIRGVWSITFKN